jgi:hypothetical protein
MRRPAAGCPPWVLCAQAARGLGPLEPTANQPREESREREGKGRFERVLLPEPRLGADIWAAWPNWAATSLGS